MSEDGSVLAEALGLLVLFAALVCVLWTLSWWWV